MSMRMALFIPLVIGESAAPKQVAQADAICGSIRSKPRIRAITTSTALLMTLILRSQVAELLPHLETVQRKQDTHHEEERSEGEVPRGPRGHPAPDAPHPDPGRQHDRGRDEEQVERPERQAHIFRWSQSLIVG